MTGTTAPEDARALAGRRWADAGLAELTGLPDGPALGPPPGFVDRLDALVGRIAAASATLGPAVAVDGLAELAVRAEPMGLRRRGRVSCGGACHLVRTADGWVAVSLARPEDRDLLPAWLGLRSHTSSVPIGGRDDDPERWTEVHERCRDRPTDALVDDGARLGLPIGALPARLAPGGSAGGSPAAPTPLPGASAAPALPGRGVRSIEELVVADLSGMWAGPLCGAVLARAGARVLKVESTGRRDGARRGPAAIWEHLNGAKEDVVVDLSGTGGRRALRDLLAGVDVVIEASRPRALAQLGVDAGALLAGPDGPTAWVSITGYGRSGPAAGRVAFGDDAAVAGGLVAHLDDGPVFCADAVADPLTGLAAAAAVLELLATDGHGLLDVPMAAVARHFSSPGGPPRPDGPAR